MPPPPANLHLALLLFCPADLPGCERFWAVWERLDGGAVVHGRYLGLLPVQDGEGLEALTDRARARFGGRAED